MRSSGRAIFAIAVGLILSLGAATPVAAQATIPGDPQSDLIEPRWLPWLGCWELTGDAVDYRPVEDTGRRVVCVSPRLDGLGVNLTTHVGSEVVGQNTVVADGRERALPESDCSGTQAASWSADGRRLFSAVTAACANEDRRVLEGMSLLVPGPRWLELQSVSLDGGEHRELVIRQYRPLAGAESEALGYVPLESGPSYRVATARTGASGSLDVDDVLEASERVPVEVVEAAIVESDSTFDLGTDDLLRIADAGIEDRVIDLMVAVSFPEEFVVDSGQSSTGRGGGGGYASYGFGYHVPVYYSCWGPYYGPVYGPYGRGCDFWRPYYGSYYAPRYGGGGGGNFTPPVPPTGSLYGGRVVNRRGYTTGRTATNAPETSVSDGIYGVSRRAVSRNGWARDGNSGGSIRGSSSGSSRRSGGSVSRSGFTRPGGSSGASSSGSSGGSSSGAKAKAKAKPKGGGS